jgi:hypothetical protein
VFGTDDRLCRFEQPAHSVVPYRGIGRKIIMKTETLTLVFAFALAFSGCSGGPASPTPPASTGPPSNTSPQSGVTDWSVTQRFGSLDGPDNCWVQAQRARWTPAVFPDLPMKVTRADGAIKVESGFFQVNYAGSFAGSDFSATGLIPLEGTGPISCPGGVVVQQLPGVSTLSGRFSADDRLLTATEMNTYPLASGGTVVYKWEWQASRRN